MRRAPHLAQRERGRLRGQGVGIPKETNEDRPGLIRGVVGHDRRGDPSQIQALGQAGFDQGDDPGALALELALNRA